MCWSLSRTHFMAAGLWASYDDENQNATCSEARRAS